MDCEVGRIFDNICYSDDRIRDFWRAHVNPNVRSDAHSFGRSLFFGVERWDARCCSLSDLTEYENETAASAINEGQYLYCERDDTWRRKQICVISRSIMESGLQLRIKGHKAIISLESQSSLTEIDRDLIKQARIEGLPAIILGDCMMMEKHGIPILHCKIFGPRQGRSTKYRVADAYVVGRLDIKIPPGYIGGMPLTIGCTNLCRIRYTERQANNLAQVVRDYEEHWRSYQIKRNIDYEEKEHNLLLEMF